MKYCWLGHSTIGYLFRYLIIQGIFPMFTTFEQVSSMFVYILMITKQGIFPIFKQFKLVYSVNLYVSINIHTVHIPPRIKRCDLERCTHDVFTIIVLWKLSVRTLPHRGSEFVYKCDEVYVTYPSNTIS